MLIRFVLLAILMTARAAQALSTIVVQPCEVRHPCDALSEAPEPERRACALKHAASIVEGTFMTMGGITTLEDAIPLRGAPPLQRDNRGLFQDGSFGRDRCLRIDEALGARVRVYMGPAWQVLYVGPPAEVPTPTLATEGQVLPGPEPKLMADALVQLLTGPFPDRQAVARALKMDLTPSSRSDAAAVFAGATTGAFAGWRASYAEESREQGPARHFVVAMTTARDQDPGRCMTTEDLGAKLLPPTWRSESNRIREEFVRDGGEFEVIVSPSPVASKESPACVDFLLIAFRRK